MYRQHLLKGRMIPPSNFASTRMVENFTALAGLDMLVHG
jgi:hypothetical protein